MRQKTTTCVSSIPINPNLFAAEILPKLALNTDQSKPKGQQLSSMHL
jgi:hypothetical protein